MKPINSIYNRSLCIYNNIAYREEGGNYCKYIYNTGNLYLVIYDNDDIMWVCVELWHFGFEMQEWKNNDPYNCKRMFIYNNVA